MSSTIRITPCFGGLTWKVRWVPLWGATNWRPLWLRIQRPESPGLPPGSGFGLAERKDKLRHSPIIAFEETSALRTEISNSTCYNSALGVGVREALSFIVDFHLVFFFFFSFFVTENSCKKSMTCNGAMENWWTKVLCFCYIVFSRIFLWSINYSLDGEFGNHSEGDTSRYNESVAHERNSLQRQNRPKVTLSMLKKSEIHCLSYNICTKFFIQEPLLVFWSKNTSTFRERVWILEFTEIRHFYELILKKKGITIPTIIPTDFGTSRKSSYTR